MPYQQKHSVKNRMMVSCFGCDAAFSQLTQQWLRFFSPFFCRVLAGSWSQRSGSKGTSCYFDKTKQAVTFSPEAMQAQEGQWDFTQKGRGHDWTCSSSRCATLPATTPLVLRTHLCRCLFGLFFWICSNTSLNPCRSFLNPDRFVFSRRKHGLTDQRPWLLVRVFFWLHIAAAPQMPRQWQPIF